MILLIGMAWVMIGEYSLHFRDYVAAAGIVIVAAKEALPAIREYLVI